MDSIELKVCNINEDITNLLGVERYNFLKFKKADKVIIALSKESLIGNVAIYYTDLEPINGEKIGMIGIIKTNEKIVAEALLKEAEKELYKNDIEKIIAPIDRDTWSEYRLCVETKLNNPFYGEPKLNTWMNETFSENGYISCYDYISTLDKLVLKEEKVVEGLTIRPIKEDNLDNDLESIYELSIEGFKDNLFYGDIVKPVFMNTYKKMYEELKPEVLIAEYDGKNVGYLIGFDGKNCIRDEKVFVFKTIVVLKEYRKLNIASSMVAKMGNSAYKKDYRKVIGGLIFSENVSFKLIEKYGGNIVSRYALFQK